MVWTALHAVIGTVVLTLASFGVGSLVYHLLEEGFQRWERLWLSLLAGWGLFSVVLYLIGQLRFTHGIILGVSTASAMGGLVFLWRRFQEYEQPSLALPRRAWIPAALVLLVLGISAVAELAPVAGDWESDTVAYHLLAPKVWLRTGIIRPVPDNCHTAFPQVAETMDAALWAIGGPSAPCFGNLLSLVFLLAAAASLAMRAGLDATGAWWVAAAVATMPAVLSGARGAFVDALFAALFLGTMRVALSAKAFSQWTAAGIMGGLLIGTKYTGLLALPILAAGLLLVPRLRPRDAAWDPWKGLGWAGLVTLLVGGVYYLRNWLMLGCPIYPPPPGLASACHAKYLSSQAILDFHQYIRQRGAGMGRGLPALFLLPFHLTYHTSSFNGGGGIGLIPLGLAPIGAICAWRKDATRFLAAIMGLLTLAWFFTQQESRFLIHVYALAAILGVIGWQQVRESAGHAARAGAALLVAVSVGYGLFMILHGEMDALRAVVSPQYSIARLHREIPYFESFAYLNGHDEVQNVLILDRSVPPFYLDKNYQKPVGQWGELTMPGISNAQEALQAAKSHSISHILDVNSPISGFQVPPDSPGLQLLFEGMNERVYRVR